MYETSSMRPPVKTFPCTGVSKSEIRNFSGRIPAYVELSIACDRFLGSAIFWPYKSTISESPSLPEIVPLIKFD